MKRRLLASVAVLAFVGLAIAGAHASPGPIERVSVDSAGNQANGDSWAELIGISAYGRYVAFESLASNLVAGDTNSSRDIFVRDRQTQTTERVSVDSDGNQGNGDSIWPAISPDGRYVVFASAASNLVEGDTNGSRDIFLRDRQTGVTERVSVNSGGEQQNSGTYSDWPDISADGRYVAFGSGASNLVPGDTNRWNDVFVRDRQAGSTERVSVDSAGNQANFDSDYAHISADGRYVAFASWSSNLVPGDTGLTDIFVHDRQTGVTERISGDSTGNQANGISDRCDITQEGRFVAFESSASNLVPGDTNDAMDIFVRDRETGITERVSVDSTEAEADENTWLPSISPDGRYVAFVSGASNLVPGDTNNSTDIFIRDRLLGSTQRVSVDSADNQGNANSNSPYISADGRYLAFASGASNLVPSDTNDRYDIFVRQQPLPVGGMAQLVDIETGAATGRSGLPAATVAAAVGAALLLASAIWYAGQQQRSLRRSRRAVRNSEPSSAPPEGK